MTKVSSAVTGHTLRFLRKITTWVHLLRCAGPIWDLAYVTLCNIRKHWPHTQALALRALRYVACVKFLRKTVALRACVRVLVLTEGYQRKPKSRLPPAQIFNVDK